MRSLLTLLLCTGLVILCSCASRPPSDDFFEEELIVEEEPFEEDFFEEEIVIEESLEEEIQVVEEPIIEPEIISPPRLESIEALGFRIQIHAFFSKAGADAAAEKARLRFPERVHVEYVAPYHKVRVGDCVTRAEADVLKARARQLGYTDAFTVETMVRP